MNEIDWTGLKYAPCRAKNEPMTIPATNKLYKYPLKLFHCYVFLRKQLIIKYPTKMITAITPKAKR